MSIENFAIIFWFFVKAISDVRFAVIDIETTGPSAEKNRIIDIACIILCGGEIIYEYESLVNPHQFIPPYISQMTGITNDMVFGSPELPDVLADINKVLYSVDTVFVAHNIGFDFRFIEESNKRIGLDFPNINKVCTLKLARRLLNKDLKKNLGSVAEYFGINIKNRHRAYGDAYATAKVLIELLEIAENEHSIFNLEDLLKFQSKPHKESKPPSVVFLRLENQIQKLPNEPGVYFFLNRKSNVHYVGKAKNLKERVNSYFQTGGNLSRKIRDMLKNSFDLKWQTTGTELAALLLESDEIKQKMPKYNTMDKSYRDYPFIKITNEEFPKVELSYSIDNDGAEYFGPFRSAYFVENIIKNIEKQFKIRNCSQTINNNKPKEPCFYYFIKTCHSPCSHKISKEEYAHEVDKIKYFLSGFSNGIIKQLEAKMNDFAEKLQFEKANAIKVQLKELRKLFERQKQVPTSVNSNNFLLMLPASQNNESIEIFLVKSGKLIYQEITKSDAQLFDLQDCIHNNFFNGVAQNIQYSEKDINEIKIITAWTFKKYEQGKFLYIMGKTEKEIFTEIEQTIIEMKTEEESFFQD